MYHKIVGDSNKMKLMDIGNTNINQRVTMMKGCNSIAGFEQRTYGEDKGI